MPLPGTLRPKPTPMYVTWLIFAFDGTDWPEGQTPVLRELSYPGHLSTVCTTRTGTVETAVVRAAPWKVMLSGTKRPVYRRELLDRNCQPGSWVVEDASRCMYGRSGAPIMRPVLPVSMGKANGMPLMLPRIVGVENEENADVYGRYMVGARSRVGLVLEVELSLAELEIARQSDIVVRRNASVMMVGDLYSWVQALSRTW
jgi:hypothetical protein